ncbi:MAG: hypothetical protein HY738_17220 [Bacteroidia bacterium]|nr:hypothetical protein [Bacteroidia bacterium]
MKQILSFNHRDYQIIKRFIFINLFGFGIATFILSCSNPEKEHRLQKVQELQRQLDKADSILRTHYHDSINIIYDDVNNKVAFIVNNMKTMPENDSLSMLISRFANIKKTLKRFFEAEQELSEQISNTRSQLYNLQYDVANSLETIENFDKYYNDEQKAIQKLCFQASKLQNIEPELHVYYKLKPVIEKFCVSLF